ncbi:MAG TPA: glycoside hydrolase family 16 protein [Chitinophagaceae bacterium]|nr:glycoside hydrolase family 16 protein [Chitinophagaceae bacterium]
MPALISRVKRLAAFLSIVLLSTGCTKKRGVLPVEITANNVNDEILIENAGICDYDLNEQSLLAAGWTKRFEEGFSGSFNFWTVWTGGAFNNELQYYQSPNLVLNDGILHIEAKRENISGVTNPFDPTPKSFQFTSGRIESNTLFSASTATPKIRMMARIKLPTGYGMWPAFWSYGDPWPTHGEIDIMEARGHEPFNYQTAYWYGRRSGINIASNTEGFVVSETSLTDCWHVYEVIWTKNSLTYLLDGQVVVTRSGGYIPNFYRKSQRVTLNLAVGGAFFGNPDPASIQTGTMQVDWVKVFASK